MSALKQWKNRWMKTMDCPICSDTLQYIGLTHYRANGLRQWLRL